MTPSAYRAAEHPAEALMPDCTARARARARGGRAGSEKPAGSAAA